MFFILVAVLLGSCGKDEFFDDVNASLQSEDQKFSSPELTVVFDGKVIWDSLETAYASVTTTLDSLDTYNWFSRKRAIDGIAFSYVWAPKQNKTPSYPGYTYTEGLLEGNIQACFLTDSEEALVYCQLVFQHRDGGHTTETFYYENDTVFAMIRASFTPQSLGDNWDAGPPSDAYEERFFFSGGLLVYATDAYSNPRDPDSAEGNINPGFDQDELTEIHALANYPRAAIKIVR